uniref:ATP synthase complex subunit 8 n=1 Tax=Poecilocoris druraei TaxID=2080378 RepID=A0A2P1CLU3_9HEMI|nr:ATP synthase F0 subunit 8 [Poecilocoris druraei]AVJ52290.1 ATP synthase F0 subunit 8 [Poecilocoris druraei]QXJ42684.1 ATP synthase F0 subunit 8 [Poecilocoris druraei]UCC46094.1 ATP synthase F0 subunit 8 [Poecilocoris druraei]
MPQMAPLYWEILFIMFIISMVIMSMIIFHYPKIYTNKNSYNNPTIKNINWKW